MSTDIDLARLWQVIWKRRGLVLLFAGAFFVLGVLYLQVAAPKYPVSIQVVPVSTGQPQAGGALGSLSQLAGVDIGGLSGNNTSAFRLYLSGVQSRTVADLLARNQDLMRGIFPEDWSAEQGAWREPPSLTRPVKNTIMNILGFPLQAWTPPAGERLYNYLQENLVVLEEAKSPVVTLRIETSRPQQTLLLLSRLNIATDSMLRERALHRADQYIGYIGRELEHVTVTEYRTALLQNLYDQEKSRMMASASVSFAGDVFSGATVGSKPSSPKAMLILIFGLAFGGVLGAFFALYAEGRGLNLPRWLGGRARKADPFGE